ncbi:MAG TPA: NAD(P)H-dependent glycerol-3-phosphate dehydrogenase [Candidatus Salinicoccus stercoripullorum]|uniref:Glycerol-3-phosphate dehydrogenase [NAD(P)+] n=1 Tax=Candidatus Salinicoccus stercoripullorum TaxID=2838756 RepID=A0A9D1TZ89_9STAP|nr:NAD(P)H-dependent glycerol-3-phosphate dehydrogenase [Candidatus Salinicoccus stercoripullorum]
MKISVIGTGSFGTSLAMVLNDNGHDVLMYGRNGEVVSEIGQSHTNQRFLKNIDLNEGILATNDLKEAAAHAELIVLAVPVKAIRTVSSELDGILSELGKKIIIVHVAKGLELGTHMRVSDVIAEEMTSETMTDICVLSGPSHAEEVALKSPTTVSAACRNPESLQIVQDIFMNKYFRVYRNDDMTGVEIGGALKNIIALAIGVLHGLEFGDNAKAALITRGLQEITRLGTRMGANPLTFLGLTGMGDLIVTATSMHSRNYRCGIMLAEGKSVDEAQEEMGMVVEGVNTTKAAFELSREYGVEMPITEVLYRYLFHGITEEEAFYALMMREKTGETDKLEDLLDKQNKDWTRE